MVLGQRRLEQRPLAVQRHISGGRLRAARSALLLVSQSVCTLAAGALGVAALVIGVDAFPGSWPILVAAFGIGIGQAVAAPTLNALVPALVDDRDLETAVSLTSLTFNVGRALGPATSGVLLATAGAEAAFALNAVTILALIGALLVIRPAPRRPNADGDRSVFAGLRHVREDRVLLWLLAGVAATGFAADPMITLAPPLAETLGGTQTLVAVLVSAFGVAAAPAAVVSGRMQRRRGSLTVAALGAGLLALGLSVAAVAPTPPIAVVGFATTGVGFVLALTGFTTVLQRRVPDDLRGRVMALWSVAFLGNRPVAAAIDGTAADLVGPRAAMLVAITVAGAALIVAVRLRHDGPGPGHSRRNAPAGTS